MMNFLFEFAGGCVAKTAGTCAPIATLYNLLEIFSSTIITPRAVLVYSHVLYTACADFFSRSNLGTYSFCHKGIQLSIHKYTILERSNYLAPRSSKIVGSKDCHRM